MRIVALGLMTAGAVVMSTAAHAQYYYPAVPWWGGWYGRPMVRPVPVYPGPYTPMVRPVPVYPGPYTPMVGDVGCGDYGGGYGEVGCYDSVRTLPRRQAGMPPANSFDVQVIQQQCTTICWPAGAPTKTCRMQCE